MTHGDTSSAVVFCGVLFFISQQLYITAQWVSQLCRSRSVLCWGLLQWDLSVLNFGSLIFLGSFFTSNLWLLHSCATAQVFAVAQLAFPVWSHNHPLWILPGCSIKFNLLVIFSKLFTCLCPSPGFLRHQRRGCFCPPCSAFVFSVSVLWFPPSSPIQAGSETLFSRGIKWTSIGVAQKTAVSVLSLNLVFVSLPRLQVL